MFKYFHRKKKSNANIDSNVAREPILKGSVKYDAFLLLTSSSSKSSASSSSSPIPSSPIPSSPLPSSLTSSKLPPKPPKITNLI